MSVAMSSSLVVLCVVGDGGLWGPGVIQSPKLIPGGSPGMPILAREGVMGVCLSS